MKSFSEYLTEATKEVVFAWGRFNPPTVGHLKLLDKVKEVAGKNKYYIYATQTNDAKKNPLTYEQKVKYMRKMFPSHARNIILDKSAKLIFDVLVSFYDQGYTKVTLVAGSDRIPEYKSLLSKYNGVKARHGFYKFESLQVVSAGQRDPDSDDVSGMSASKMRAAASENNIQLFSQGMPPGFKEVTSLFNDVRSGMGLSESFQFRQHVEFQPISEEREQYVAGQLLSESDEVVIKSTDEVGKIVKCGSNYVIVKLSEGKTVRKWITDVERLGD